MVEETPTGMMEENGEEGQGEPTREQLEFLAQEIFQLRLEELNEEQLMIVYQAAMEQQPEEMAMQEEDIQFDPQMAQPQMAADGGRIGYGLGSWVKGKLGLGQRHGVAYTGNTGAQSGNFKDNLLNVFSNKLSGRNTAVAGSPVATSNSFMGNLLSQDADYQAYLASGSDLPYEAWKTSRSTAAEGGLMSLGGMEKDYRNEGGFVPLGKKEKADDVPARLSKNEFVFTADAVRNAGGGNIDKGAEVMQNMMHNLEAGGQISEDSQGAQGMYNNTRQLETRIA